MTKHGWIINDKLTCIPGTKTFWHDLLDWIPGLISKADDISFHVLANKIENDFNSTYVKPYYLIRNATFFRRMNLPVKTISLLQDSYIGGGNFGPQIDVCNSSDVTVFNSPFIYEHYKSYIKQRTCVIPLGTDFDFFTPMTNKTELRNKYGFKVNEPLFIFIGSSTVHPKGFDVLSELINTTNYNFCLVMKDDYVSTNPRVKVFNKIDHSKLKELINCCDAAICTSKMETLHLSGIECAACDIPVLATNVGVYYNDFNNNWGKICSTVEDFRVAMKYVLVNKFNTRNEFLNKKLDKHSCKNSWLDLVNSI